MRDVLDGMRNAGIGKATVAGSCRFFDAEPKEIADLLSRINETLRKSPAPTHESKALRKVLGIDLLAQLTGMKAGDARTCPGVRREMRDDPIVERLHFLALLVGELAGSYTDVGVRRWFDRPRKALAGETPAQTLGHEWRPDDEGPIRVRELAAASSASSATRSRSGVAIAGFPFCGKCKPAGRTMERERPIDALFQRYAGWRVGRVPAHSWPACQKAADAARRAGASGITAPSAAPRRAGAAAGAVGKSGPAWRGSPGTARSRPRNTRRTDAGGGLRGSHAPIRRRPNEGFGAPGA